jgi:hypothetical protein
MMKPSIKMPSPAMLVALLALFVALGGSAYAVNKVGTNQNKNNAVTTPKLKNNAVTTAKIKKGAVKAANLSGGSVTSSKLGAGAIGSQVEYTGESLVEGYESEITVPPDDYLSGAVSCPDDKAMIFASWRPLVSQSTPPLAIADMDLFPDEHSMRVEFFNGSDQPQQAALWGICI